MDAGILSGPLVGGLMAAGSHLITGVTNWLAAKQKFKERELEMKHEATMFPLKLEASREENAWRGFIASQEAAKQVPDSTPWWASAALTLTRPALTLLLVIISTIALMRCQDAARQADAITQVIEMTGVVIGWWFGTRQISKASK